MTDKSMGQLEDRHCPEDQKIHNIGLRIPILSFIFHIL